MKKLALATATIAALALSASSFAKVTETAPDFSYVEAGYSSYDFDGLDADGITINGSFELSETAFVNYMYSNAETDGLDDLVGAEVDMDNYSIGIGARHALSANTALFGSVNYLRSEADFFDVDVSGNGYGINAGVKSRLAPEIEITGTVSYNDIEVEGESEDGVTGQVDLRYYFTNDIALGLSYAVGEDTDTISVGARYSF